MTLDVLRDLPAVREEDPEFALAAVLEAKANGGLAMALRAELDRLRPVDITVSDVTTVSEALKAAEERYAGLVVLAEAERSAAKRGHVGVAKAREALFALGEIADRYAAGELDEGLDEALATLPGFKPDISDTAKAASTGRTTSALCPTREGSRSARTSTSAAAMRAAPTSTSTATGSGSFLATAEYTSRASGIRRHGGEGERVGSQTAHGRGTGCARA